MGLLRLAIWSITPGHILEVVIPVEVVQLVITCVDDLRHSRGVCRRGDLAIVNEQGREVLSYVKERGDNEGPLGEEPIDFECMCLPGVAE